MKRAYAIDPVDTFHSEDIVFTLDVPVGEDVQQFVNGRLVRGLREREIVGGHPCLPYLYRACFHGQLGDGRVRGREGDGQVRGREPRRGPEQCCH
jgi:hypothetical protein